MSLPQQFDIIFAGGGTCACLTAGRLAAADPSLKILIIEAGDHTRDLPVHTQPARYFYNIVAAGPTLFQHIGKPSPVLGGRQPATQSGKCVGGGSCVNFMMYTRASASDYDDWKKLGNPGWGSEDLIPCANKVETYDGYGRSGHGTSGPIKISRGGFQTSISQDFLNTAKTYDPDRGQTNDTNDFVTCNKYSNWDMYIDPLSGKRSDTAHYFIYNQEHNKNLHILAKHRVVRVIFEDDRAVGVEYVDDSKREDLLQAFASRLVVLSAGAFGSVAILERSGIGSKAVLSKIGVQQVVDLPGVGENYNDHNLGVPAYRTYEENRTLDSIFRNEQDAIDGFVVQWQKDGSGPMAHNSIEAGIKIRPNAKDLEELGPEFTDTWNTVFANTPDKAVMWIGPATACVGVYPESATGKFFTMLYYTEYPRSTGRVHVQSGPDPYFPMEFEPGYLNDPADLVVLRWAYKRGRELARRMKSYRGSLLASHPKFSQASSAAVLEREDPVDNSSEDIVYSAEDDAKIDEYHRATVATTWHSLGTCAMKPREQGGVVDANLNVYGVKNLKICDMSIAPSNVGANTYNTALIIGEKGALIIARELGLPEP